MCKVRSQQTWRWDCIVVFLSVLQGPHPNCIAVATPTRGQRFEQPDPMHSCQSQTCDPLAYRRILTPYTKEGVGSLRILPYTIGAVKRSTAEMQRIAAVKRSRVLFAMLSSGQSAKMMVKIS